MPSQISAQGLGSADFRPPGQPLQHAQDAQVNHPGQSLQLLARFLRQDYVRHEANRSRYDI
jgi:hypothetical protein